MKISILGKAGTTVKHRLFLSCASFLSFFAPFIWQSGANKWSKIGNRSFLLKRTQFLTGSRASPERVYIITLMPDLPYCIANTHTHTHTQGSGKKRKKKKPLVNLRQRSEKSSRNPYADFWQKAQEAWPMINNFHWGFFSRFLHRLYLRDGREKKAWAKKE